MKTIFKGDILPFSEALYYSICRDCKSTLEWIVDFDADGSSYHARCCGRGYNMNPHTVTIDVNPIEK